MRGPARELANRLHFLRLAQPGFRRPALGDVPRNLGVADQMPVRSDGVDNDVGPETGAILAQAPALGLQPAFSSCGAQSSRRNSRRPVLLGIKALEILADNIRRFVTLDALRARIPTDDAPGRIQHV